MSIQSEIMEEELDKLERKIKKLEKKNTEYMEWLKEVKSCNAHSMFPHQSMMKFQEFIKKEINNTKEK